MTWTNPVCDSKKAFNNARHSAAQRGIQFNLTYLEWWQLWREYWPAKEIGAELALARYADWGPYERGNCRVITIKENNAEKHRVTKIVNEIQKCVTHVTIQVMLQAHNHQPTARTGKLPLARPLHCLT